MNIKFKKVVAGIIMFGYAVSHSTGFAQEQALKPNTQHGAPISMLADLKNFQVNTPKMISSGLPTQQHFEALKTMGITMVVDLIPGDRTEEANLMVALELPYHNISVDWENPTVENFEQYVKIMNQSYGNDGITLTHCKLNWRGSVFTYLYRTTQLNESEESAKQDLVAMWPQPNDVWLAFIDKVKAKYK